jgi:TetR/AcrR family transcriptional regulator
MATDTDEAEQQQGSRREQRRRRHQLLSREQLLDAAEEIFGRKGYHETTLKEVAELAEFSVGSVYSFFANKDDLFRQIFVRRGSEFMPEIRRVLASEGTPVELLHRLVDFEVRWFREHRHFGRLYLRHANVSLLSDDREIDAAIAANHHESMALQADLFRRGQHEGVFRRGDPEVLARLFSGIMAAFQALDPAVVSDEPEPGERFPVADLHDLIAATFAAPGATRG